MPTTSPSLRRRTVRRRWAAALLPLALLAAACGSGGGSTPGGGPGTGTPTAAPSASPGDDLLSGEVQVAVKYNQPGFNVQREIEFSGFENELMKSLAKRLHLKVVPSRTDSAYREGLLTGKDRRADLVIATYSITKERKKKVDFVGPYLTTYQGLLVRKGYDGIKNVRQTAGKGICTVEGSTSDPEHRTELGNQLPEGADVAIRDSYQDCITQLKKGDFEAVLTDKAILYGFAEHDKKVEVLDRPDGSFDLGGQVQLYGIGIPKGHPESCERLAGALKGFLEDEWLSKFQPHFQKLSRKGDVEETYKPPASLVDKYSCQ